MKALKVVGVIILILIGFSLIIPLFMADEVTVSSRISIDAKPATVFNQVNDYRNWAYWSPFEEDSTIVNTYEGPKVGVGSIRHWSGKTAGDGTMTILESTPFQYIKNELDFGPDGGGIGEWSFTESENGCDVSWFITVNDLSYPFGKLFSPLIGGLLTPMLDSGLESLKLHSESLPNTSQISVIETTTLTTLAIYDSVKMAELSGFFGESYGALMEYIHANGYAIAGAPLAVYHNWDPENFIKVSAAIPIHGKAKEKDNIRLFTIESGKAVYAQHFGGYNTENTHYLIDDYIKEYNLAPKDFIWEVYVTDTESEPDSTKWQTDIYYPIK